MRIIKSWLAEYINLGDQTNDELADTFENLGHEVEGVQTSQLPETVVIGHVLELSAHPNADRLRVAVVDTGDTQRTIVCGAANLEVDQKVVVALCGTTLPNGLVIEKRAIRGVESDGMICAADEIGLSDDHSGIIVLPPDSVPGQRFRPDNGEAVFDLAITPNRGDALSYLGLARDLAAKWKQPLLYQSPSAPDISADQPEVYMQISVESDDCRLYTLRPITNISQLGLPSQLNNRLKLSGHQLYHPVVDITNYVMEELGVPLHGFDADKVVGALTVRAAKVGESIELLNNKTYTLDETMLVIADTTGPIALAGIMGGTRTAISDNTQKVLLEAAYFNPISIRRTRTKLGLATTASYRYERGVDPACVREASDRATYLISEYLRGQSGQRFEIGDLLELVKNEQQSITINTQVINERLGSNFEVTEIVGILNRLGFANQGDIFTTPSWRHDATLPEDLIEEVARIAGFDQLSRTYLEALDFKLNVDDERWSKIEQLKDLLASDGWSEQIGTSFLSEREVKLMGLEVADLIKLANPASEEAAFLRPTQILSTLKVIAKNPIFSDLKIFEIGTVWKPTATEHNGEQTALTLAWTGTKPIKFTFAPDRQFGSPVSSDLLAKLKIRRPVMISEVPISLLIEHLTDPKPVMSPMESIKFRVPSRYQPAIRDIAILVDQAINPTEISDKLLTVDHVVDVELFDHFSGGKLPQGKQSLAFHLLLENQDKALEGLEIDGIIDRVTELVTNKFSALIR